MRFMLSDYIASAMQGAVYSHLKDGQYHGRIPSCPGVVAFAKTSKACQVELQSVLEDWIFLGLRMQHHLPVLSGINLNQKPRRERLEAV